ncbi:family 16 glycosylhydrolase [uncultured Algibacter sp.]|uniref:family 16 glycosylhydrolase n=1 Tax=uncultured Algibacter sp. TaxID=298659 RepID=UPI00260ABBD8|nr:family 16 glycosylhydrolase [uncultured Algibacter sp.]
MNLTRWILFCAVLFAISISTTNCSGSKDQPNDDEQMVGEGDDDDTTTNCEESYSHELSAPTEEVDLSSFELTWVDEFDYDDSKLEEIWASQNGLAGHILCSRWRENAVIENGVLELKAKKEQRGGQDWTCGNIWTKETFGYGYYECKYKYAGASGTNNSFWLFPRDQTINSPEVICELDVNEGHFPNEVNTNRHHWQNGNTENNQLQYSEGLSPAYAHSFNESVKTNRIRFSSNNSTHFHIREFRIYEQNTNCYPTGLLSNTADNSVTGLTNLSRESDTEITASGVLRDEFKVSAVADGTSTTSWVSQKEGEKWLEFTWPEEKNIGHIQFINGWLSGSNWNSLISDYKIEAFVDGDWVEITTYDVEESNNFAEDYHVYGMDWSEDQVKFYYDNKLIRSIPNTLCKSELNIFLSLAILEHGGEVTDAIDGTSMKIDWVKYYKRK